MLDRKLLQRNPEIVVEALQKRSSEMRVDDFTQLDTQRRALLGELEALQAERNAASAKVAEIKRSGQGNAEAIVQGMGAINTRIKELEQKVANVDEALDTWLLSVPTRPTLRFPLGKMKTTT